MNLLILGLVLFLGAHLAREVRLREGAIARLGRRNYRIVFSLVAVAGVALVILGKASSPFVMIYEPRYELRGISHFVMLPAFVLVVAGNLPLSHLRRAIRNPMLLGTALWGGAHLWANGDLASILLFGSFTVWAIIKFVSLAGVPEPAERASLLWDLLAVVFGFILYSVVTVFHGHLFGIGLTFG